MVEQGQSDLQLLSEVGFTDMESRVYLALLERGPQSGYRVARAIGKANSNTYAAIETLERRGVLVSEDDSPRVYRALPVDEMLGALQRSFEHRRDRVKRHLRSRVTRRGEEGAFRLTSADAVLERCADVLHRACTVALIDAFPRSLNVLAGPIAEATQRGVDVLVKAYAPIELSASTVIVSRAGDDIVARWDGDWLTVAVDGIEAVFGFLTDGLAAVRQATWVRGTYIAAPVHNGVASELVLAWLDETAAVRPELPVSTAMADASEMLFRRARAYAAPRDAHAPP